MSGMGLIYLKDRDQIVASLPEQVRRDDKRIQDELDFYPVELKGFMGMTVEGIPGAWRYRGDNGNIFDVSLSLTSATDRKPNGKFEIFTLKDTWFDCLNPEHKKMMLDRIGRGLGEQHIPVVESGEADAMPPADGLSPDNIDDEFEEEEYGEDEYSAEFEEDALVYLKTPAEMNISEDAFREGRFVASQYYPEALRYYVGKTLPVTVKKFYTETDRGDGSAEVIQRNEISFEVSAVSEDIVVLIPVDMSEIDGENPSVLMFDYKNWLSLFTEIVEATGPNLSELVNVNRLLHRIGADSTVVETSYSGTAACSKPVESRKDGIYVLATYKHLGVSEEQFYAKSFGSAGRYPDKLISQAGTVVEAQIIDKDTALIMLDKVPYEIYTGFLFPIDCKLEKDQDNDAFMGLEEFGAKVKEAKKEFSFIKCPDLKSRVVLLNDKSKLSDVIAHLSSALVLKRYSVELYLHGVTSDFIVVTGFKEGATEITLPLWMLDLLMFHEDTRMFEKAIVLDSMGTAICAVGDSDMDVSLTGEVSVFDDGASDISEELFIGPAIHTTIKGRNETAGFVKLSR